MSQPELLSCLVVYRWSSIKELMMRVFVAGASGAIGRQLVPRLVAAGHEVHGMTRSESKQAMLVELGAVLHRLKSQIEIKTSYAFRCRISDHRHRVITDHRVGFVCRKFPHG